MQDDDDLDDFWDTFGTGGTPLSKTLPPLGVTVTLLWSDLAWAVQTDAYRSGTEEDWAWYCARDGSLCQWSSIGPPSFWRRSTRAKIRRSLRTKIDFD